MRLQMQSNNKGVRRELSSWSIVSVTDYLSAILGLICASVFVGIVYYGAKIMKHFKQMQNNNYK